MSDFFLRGRQFFGFLIPGIIWAAAGALLFFRTVAFPFRDNPKWPNTALFLMLSYLIGFALNRLSFSFVRGLSLKLQDKAATVRIRRRLMDLRARVRKQLRANYIGQPGFVLPPKNRLAAFCKRFIREKTAVLGKDLDSYEEEINFVGMLPLPMLVLVVASLVASSRGQLMFGYAIIIIAGSLVIASFCAYRFRQLLY